MLKWDQPGEKNLEAGVSHVALYPWNSTLNSGKGGYGNGIAWSGVTGFNENPSGADVTDLYADNVKYASLRAAEKYGFTIEAYQYPEEWAECDGSAIISKGVYLGQQNRKAFGLVVRTQVGDDQHPGLDKGYKIHIIYNSTASPSGRSYATINENPDAITMSWEGSSTPVAFTTNAYKDYKPVSTITIDTSKLLDVEDAAMLAKVKALEDILYGNSNNGGTSAVLPSPDDVLAMLA